MELEGEVTKRTSSIPGEVTDIFWLYALFKQLLL